MPPTALEKVQTRLHDPPPPPSFPVGLTPLFGVPGERERWAAWKHCAHFLPQMGRGGGAQNPSISTIYSLTAPEAEPQNQGVSKATLSPKPLGEHPFSLPPASVVCRAPWLVDTHHPDVRLHRASPDPLAGSSGLDTTFPLPIRIWLPCDLILTNHICKDLTSK